MISKQEIYADSTLRPQPVKNIVITGKVVDSVLNVPLRFVTVRAEFPESRALIKGAITNSNGEFILKLPRLADSSSRQILLTYSMIGFRKKNQILTIAQDSLRVPDVGLSVASFQIAEITVSAEDPAVRLMRKVIERKNRQRDSLRTYSYMLYTKFVASLDTVTAGRASGRADTTIFSIFESYSKGYFAAPDKYFNEIIQRRQTANIPPQANFVAFGTNINCYDDFVTIITEEIYTPFHPNALDYYEFTLERSTFEDDETTLQRVRVRPKSNDRKLFSGFLEIDVKRLIPTFVELVPNKAVQVPFDAEFRFKQKFDETSAGFVLPTGLNIFSSLQANIFWIISPRIDVSIETIAFDYETNIEINNEKFTLRRVEIAEQADEFDSTYWRDHTVLPLRAEESRAYEEIRILQEFPDSLESSSIVTRYFREINNFFLKLNRRPFTGFEDVFHYNRVQGAYLGVGLTGFVFPKTEVTAKIGYGLADKYWNGEFTSRQFFDEAKRFAVGVSVFRKLSRRDNPYMFTTAGITPLALLFKNDYGDYYYSSGGEAWFEAGFGQLRFARREQFIRPTTIRFFVRNEDQSTAYANTSFGVFGRNREFRPNPSAYDGTLRSVGFELAVNFSPIRRITDAGFQVAGEFSEPDLLPTFSRFEYYTFSGVLRTKTLPLWRLDIRANAGYARGNVPPQRFFSFESAATGFAQDATFRAMQVKEFYGNQYAALSLEHSFGEIIPGLLRIPNIASFGIEFIGMARAGWSKFTPEVRDFTKTSLTSTDETPSKIYTEYGIGLNRILLFFRFDVTARISQYSPPIWRITLSGATL